METSKLVGIFLILLLLLGVLLQNSKIIVVSLVLSVFYILFNLNQSEPQKPIIASMNNGTPSSADILKLLEFTKKCNIY